MKLFLYTFLFLFLIIACENEEKPEIREELKDPIASFSVAGELIRGKEITFINGSTDATTYNWTFGDGTISSEFSPKHTFSKVGAHQVTLTAINAEKRKDTTITLPIKWNPVDINGLYAVHLEERASNSDFVKSLDTTIQVSIINEKTIYIWSNNLSYIYDPYSPPQSFYDFSFSSYGVPYYPIHKAEATYFLENDSLVYNYRYTCCTGYGTTTDIRGKKVN